MQPTVYVENNGRVGRPKHLACENPLCLNFKERTNPSTGKPFKATHTTAYVDSQRDLRCSKCEWTIAMSGRWMRRTLQASGQWQNEPGNTAPTEPQEPQAVEPEPITIDSEPEPEPTSNDPFEDFDRKFYALREFCNSRDALRGKLDSMRAMLDSYALIAKGLPVDGILSNMISEFTDDLRVQSGISEFDWAAWGQSKADDFEHATSPAIALAIEAGIPVYIHGPAGSGKSSGAKLAAEKMGLPYYEINLSGATPAALTGRDRLKEFVESRFVTAYRDGGIANLEEFDNAHPQVATVVNNAIAGDEFHNPVTGEAIPRHEDFRIVATANTLGTGAKDGYVRNKLDGATLDRFRVGRFCVKLDTRLERNILDALKSKLTD